jgi:hypothetical protein
MKPGPRPGFVDSGGGFAPVGLEGNEYMLDVFISNLKQTLSEIATIIPDWTTSGISVGLAVLAVLAVAVATGNLWRNLGRVLPGRIAFFTVMLSIALLGSLGALRLLDRQQPTAAVAAAAATLAGLQWLAQQRLQIRLHRKQHTLRLIMDIRQNDTFQRHRVNIFHHHPNREAVTLSDLKILIDGRDDRNEYEVLGKGDYKSPLIESYLYILNINEVISAAVLQEDLDRDLVKSSIRDLLEGYYDKASVLISHFYHGHPKKVPYENYIKLMELWGKPVPAVLPPVTAVQAPPSPPTPPSATAT